MHWVITQVPRSNLFLHPTCTYSLTQGTPTYVPITTTYLTEISRVWTPSTCHHMGLWWLVSWSNFGHGIRKSHLSFGFPAALLQPVNPSDIGETWEPSVVRIEGLFYTAKRFRLYFGCSPFVCVTRKVQGMLTIWKILVEKLPSFVKFVKLYFQKAYKSAFLVRFVSFFNPTQLSLDNSLIGCMVVMPGM